MADTLPRARVHLEFIGWSVKVTGEQPVTHAHWSWREAMDYADLAVRLRRRRWHARGCVKCVGGGVVPDWSNWNREHGEPRPKPCPACQFRHVGAVLTSADPEPGHDVTVEDTHGRRWRRTDGNHNGGGGANWEQEDVQYFEPESWTHVAGNGGPVRIVEVEA